MKFYATIGEGELEFSSALARHRFYQLKGQKVIVQPDDAPTAEMRRFFEGALVPAVFYQNDVAGWEDVRDAREAIKLEFLPAYIRDTHGNRVRLARSTTTLSKEKFREFIEVVLRWMEEQGYELPDSEDFKRWRDSAPGADEVYPPLRRVMEAYERRRGVR